MTGRRNLQCSDWVKETGNVTGNVTGRLEDWKTGVRGPAMRGRRGLGHRHSQNTTIVGTAALQARIIESAWLYMCTYQLMFAFREHRQPTVRDHYRRKHAFANSSCQSASLAAFPMETRHFSASTAFSAQVQEMLNCRRDKYQNNGGASMLNTGTDTTARS